jgi:hypothetical protein
VRINHVLFLCLTLVPAAARADLMLDVSAPFSAVPGGAPTTFNVPGFDPALGHLNRVSFGYGSNFDPLTIALNDPASGPLFAIPTVGLHFTRIGAPLNTFSDSNDVLGFVTLTATPVTLTTHAEPPGVSDPDAGRIPLNLWAGASVPIALVATLFDFNNLNTSAPPPFSVTAGTATGVATVRYVYAPAAAPTPEPPTLVTALLGLVGAGGWWIWRKAA